MCIENALDTEVEVTCIFENEITQLLKISTQSQFMRTITWAKKKSKQIYLYRTKGTYCGYMGDCKKIQYQHSF